MSTTPTLSLDYVFVVTGESLVLESLFPRMQQMLALKRRISDQEADLIKLEVTASDGKTVGTYAVRITRQNVA